MQRVVGYEFVGERHDVGDKFGFVRATVEFALEREDLKPQVMEYLRGILDRVKVER
jgi:UTP--glucose-1-phosphate uridylyltransferase